MQTLELIHEHFEPFSVFFFRREKNVSTNQKIFGRAKTFSAEDFFVRELFTNIRKNENL